LVDRARGNFLRKGWGVAKDEKGGEGEGEETFIINCGKAGKEKVN